MDNIRCSGMVVLSLFNGMNTGRQALENLGVKVERYYSSEIKKFAIELTQHHFPDTVQLGDGWTLPLIEHIFSFLPREYFNK